MRILEIKNVSSGYGEKEIIKEVSFSVDQGSVVGIIGPNGAGKTTLFRAITKLLPLSKGEVIYKNQDILKISSQKLAKEVAVVPQFLDIPFSFSVEEFVTMSRFPHIGRFGSLKKNDRLAIAEALKLTDSAILQSRKIFELSAGERQCVFLAQAFAQEPQLLFLDEPTAHLDIGHQVRIMEMICNLNKKDNLTVLIVLHDLNLASQYCDKLILLNNGEISKQGSIFDVLRSQIIETVYQTPVVIEISPITHKPYILLAPLDKNKELK